LGSGSLHRDEILERLKPVLASREYAPEDAGSAVPSAVLVIIHYHGGRPQVFLTKRSPSLKSHSGEVSFPGGRYAKDDKTLVATALRETEEEIGITFKPEQVIGSLKAVRTMTSNHFIVPFLTVQEKLPEHRVSAVEVEAVVDAPLVETLQSIEPDTEHYRLAANAVRFTFDNNVIWGATARILEQLHDALIG
jgi:8-oxo-dGTP pyrophosphatase MutT (NUDIX family)